MNRFIHRSQPLNSIVISSSEVPEVTIDQHLDGVQISINKTPQPLARTSMTDATDIHDEPVESPVALCIFNRPDTTRRVFDRIAQARPSRLFVFADGPRADVAGESALTDEARNVVANVTWECDAKFWYSDVNLGCRLRMQSGIDWVFEQVDRAIILEDDTLPSQSFFRYCDILLNQYAGDPRVMMISGDHFQPDDFHVDSSYYFSKWPHIWGWATWRRAWEHQRNAQTLWFSHQRDEIMRQTFPRTDEREYWTTLLESCFRGEVDTWDFEWCFAIWSAGGLTALPTRNLVTNIGFDRRATHTTDEESRWANLRSFEWSMENHPREVHAHERADRWTFENVFAPHLCSSTTGKSSKKAHRANKAGRRFWNHMKTWLSRSKSRAA